MQTPIRYQKLKYRIAPLPTPASPLHQALNEQTSKQPPTAFS